VLAEMRQWCGTSSKYPGLYSTLGTAAIPPEATTASLEWDFPPAHRIEGYRHSMIEVSRAHDPLKYLAKRDWESDPEHPDIDAVNEAEKLAQALEAGNRLDEVAAKPADFRKWMEESVLESRQLHEELSAFRGGETAALERANRAFDAVNNLCSRCHTAYRNE
jgi:hypothetical protein